MEEKFGKYEVIGRLGEGAMGVVYEAQDPILKRRVAIKTISASLGGDNELRQRFEREAQAAASLNHPNIITIHDFGEEKGKIYMAMELLEGKDLKERIAEGELTNLNEKLSVMEQICDGLAFAHDKRIVHRDLKPGNIHIQPNGQVKVLDFGLARLGSSDMTKTGIVMGTPNYMSPEQVMGEKVDARSDVFALGAVFYEILTNHKPFEADSVHAVLYQVVHKEPQPVRDWDPEVPAILIELVEKALSKDPVERFPNAGAMREALKHIRQAIRTGQLASATLADMLDLETVDEADLGPVAARSRADSSSPALDEGTIAMDVTKPATRRPGPRTMPGRPATQAPAAAPQGFTPRPIEPSRMPYYVAGGVVVLALVAGGVFLALQQRQAPAPGPGSDASSAQVGALTEALVQTQLDLAHRVLADKDYQGAIDQAERALKLDPENTAAKGLVEEARNKLFDLDAAATEARQAFDAGDTKKASEALSKVLALDPKHPVAAELTAKLNRFFRSQAEDARAAMDASRSAAEKAGGSGYGDFSKAGSLVQNAQAQFSSQQFAVATQNFLQARDGYDRARRAAEADAQKRAADKAAAEKASADRAVAAARAAQAPATAPPPPTTAARPVATLAPATQPPATSPPVTAPPATQPAVPGVTFATDQTKIQGVTSGGPAGFDMSGVTLSDFKGQMEFDVEPRALHPGDRYKIKIYLVNTGEVSVKLAKAETMTNVNGRRTRDTLKLDENDVKTGKRTKIAEISGVWPGGVDLWTLDVAVTSEKGEKYRNRLSLQ